MLCTKFPDAPNTCAQYHRSAHLEKVGSVEPAFAERYLRAIDTELARQILDYYGREWVNFDPPFAQAHRLWGHLRNQPGVSARFSGLSVEPKDNAASEGYALSSSDFYEYMTQIVHPILRWYPASL